MTNSIFISVPSVEDQEIFHVAEKAFDEADNPDDIYMGICHSVPFKYKKRIDEIKKKITGKNISQKFINFYRSEGVGYGRINAMSMYSGQDYILQIDGHTNFAKSWDSKVLEMYKSVPKDLAGDKHMLTAYLPGYELLKDNVRNSPDENMPRYPCWTSINNTGTEQGLYPEDLIRNPMYPHIPRWVTVRSVDNLTTKGLPYVIKKSNIVDNLLPEGYVYSRKINANFIFSDHRLYDDYKYIYPWHYLFFEEEFIGSIEALSRGYNMIFPHFELPLAHLYMDWYNDFYTEESRQNPEPSINSYRESIERTDRYLQNPNNQLKVKEYCDYAGLSYPEFESVDTFYIPRRENED
jgi:hypothetical protein